MRHLVLFLIATVVTSTLVSANSADAQIFSRLQPKLRGQNTCCSPHQPTCCTAQPVSACCNFQTAYNAPLMYCYSGVQYPTQQCQVATPSFGIASQATFSQPNNIVSATAPLAVDAVAVPVSCLLYTSPSPRDRTRSRMPSSA